MALERDQLTIDIEIDSGEADKSLGSLSKALKAAQDQIKALEKIVASSSKSMSSSIDAIPNIAGFNSEPVVKSLDKIGASAHEQATIVGDLLGELDDLEKNTIGAAREFIVLVTDDQVDTVKALTGEMETLNKKEKELVGVTTSLIQGFFGLVGVAVGFKAVATGIRLLLVDSGFLGKRFRELSGIFDNVRVKAISAFKSMSASLKNTLDNFAPMVKKFTTVALPILVAFKAGALKTFDLIGKGLKLAFTGVKDIKKTGIAIKDAFLNLENRIPSIVTLTTGLSGLKIGFEGISKGAAKLASGPLKALAGGLGAIGSIVIGNLIFAIKSLINNFIDLGVQAAKNVRKSFADMSKSMESFTQETKQFSFVINSFNKTLGPEFAGTLEGWNDLIDDLGDNTAFTVSDIRKSIGLLVKESQILGFTSKQIEEVIKRSSDVAANSNKTLFDTTQRLVSGFAGMSQSALALGVDLRQQTIQHGTLTDAMKDGKDEAGKYALNQMRLSAFMEQTLPIIGAAELQLDSLAAVQSKAADQLQRLKGVFAGTAIVTKFYARTLIDLINLVRIIPDPLIRAAGVVTELTAAFVIGLLTVLKLVVSLGALAIVLVTVNAIISASVAVQTVLNTVFAAAATHFGVATVAVTSLSVAMSNLLIIIKAQIIQVFLLAKAFLVGLTPAIVTATTAVKTFLVALAPLLIKVAIVVGIFILLKNAFETVLDTLGPLTQTLTDAFISLDDIGNVAEEATEQISLFDQATEALVERVRVIISVLSGLAELIVVGLVSALLLANNAIIRFRMLFADAGEETEKFENLLFENEQALGLLAGTTLIATEKIVTFGDEAAIAAVRADVLVGTASKLQKEIAKLEPKKALEGYTEAVRGIKELERDILEINQSTVATIGFRLSAKISEISKVREELDLTKQLTSERQKQLSLLANQTALKAALDIQKLQLGAAKQIANSNKNLSDQLETANLKGKELATAQLNIELEKVSAKQAQLKAEGLLSDTAVKGLEEQKRLLTELSKIKTPAGSGGKNIDKERLDAIKGIASENANIANQTRTIGLEGAALLAEQLDIELEKIQAKEDLLVLDKLLTQEAVVALEAQRELVKSQFNSQAQQQAIQLAERRLEVTKSIAAKNVEIANQLLTSGLEGKNLLDLELAIELEKIEAKKAQLVLSGTSSAQAIAGLNQQKVLLAQISEQKIFAVQVDALDDVLDRLEALRGIQRKSGLEGSELAKENLKIQLDGLKKAAELLEAQGAFEGDKGKALQANLKKELKITKEIGQAKIAAAEEAEGFDFGAVASGAGDFLSGIADMAINAFDSLASLGESDDPLGLIKVMESLPEIIGSAMDALPELLGSFVEGMAEAIDTILAKLPEMLTKILDMLPMIIETIFDALGKIVDALPAIFLKLADALPGLISSIFDAIPELIDKIFEAIPGIIAAIISAIPDIIVNILDRLPDIIESLISGIIGAVVEIAVSFVDVFINQGGARKIVFAMMKAMIVTIPKAIVVGILEGIKRGLKSFFQGFEIPGLDVEPFKKEIENVVNSASAGAAKVAKDVFGLIDLPEAGKGLEAPSNPLEDIVEAASLAGKKIVGFLEGWLNKLKLIWDEVLNKVLKPFLALLEKAWKFIWNKILKPIAKAFKEAFQIFVDILLQLGSIVGVAFQAVSDIFNGLVAIVLQAFDAVFKLFNGLAGIVQEAFSIVFQMFDDLADTVKSAFQAVLDLFSNLGETVKSAFQSVFDLFNGLAETVKSAFDPVVEAFDGIFDPFVDAANGLKTSLEDVASPFTDLASALNNFKIEMPDIDIPDVKFPEFNGNDIGNDIGNAFSKVIQNAFAPLKTIANAFIDVVNAMKIGPVGWSISSKFGSSSGTLFGEQDLIPGNIEKFAEGGLVGGFFDGTDNQVIAAQPGEFVFNRRAVDSLGSGTLAGINETGRLPGSGGLGGGAATVNIQSGAIVVSMTEGQSPLDVADTVIDEIRRRTLDGEFIIDSAGIRSA